jgi:hypothetical protein
MFIRSYFFIKDNTFNISGFYANSKLISITGGKLGNPAVIINIF